MPNFGTVAWQARLMQRAEETAAQRAGRARVAEQHGPVPVDKLHLPESLFEALVVASVVEIRIRFDVVF